MGKCVSGSVGVELKTVRGCVCLCGVTHGGEAGMGL